MLERAFISSFVWKQFLSNFIFLQGQVYDGLSVCRSVGRSVNIRDNVRSSFGEMMI